MKNFIFYYPLILLALFSCEKSPAEDPTTAVILAHTCGGTVIKFISVNIGEEWINNFDDANIYNNVALTNYRDSEGYQAGDSISFNFKEVNELEGNVCDIGGLPKVKVQLNNLNKLK